LQRIRIDDKELRQEFIQEQDLDGLYDLVHSLLLRHADADYKEYIGRIVPGGGHCHGTPVTVLRALSRQVGIALRENPRIGIPLLSRLWESGCREERRIAAESVAYYFARDPDAAYRLVMGWLADMNNWEICDVMATAAFKPYAVENPQIAFRLAASFVKSPNPWLRRFGLVMLIPLAHKPRLEEQEPFFYAIKEVLKDDDENVQKAASWLLREITAKDASRTARFLQAHATDQHPACRRIIREGSRKLPARDREELLKLVSA
jgi:3-methyladenine DNA glycosylase AlkD